MTIEKLNSRQMAEFVARGVLRFDGRVPDDINDRFIVEGNFTDTPGVGPEASRRREQIRKSLEERGVDLAARPGIPKVPAGTPLINAYEEDTALGRLVRLPWVRGAIESLVGPGSRVDHHFVHLNPPMREGEQRVAQPTHQDSTIDPRQAFDVQMFYFPHEVTADMGGTRYIPGTHLRIVSEAAIARYQNIRGQQHVACPAGTVLFAHHGLWHGGGLNASSYMRCMFKVRLNPTVRQQRLWDTSDLTQEDFDQRPIFYIGNDHDPDSVQSILTRYEPWFEADTGRLEFINRVRLWRFLLGDNRFDADYWVTRIENEPNLVIC